MMVAVVALGLLGAAYTLWYEDLTLKADIKTGVFDVDWSCEEPFKENGAPGPLQQTPDPGTTDCPTSARPVVSLDQGKNWYWDGKAKPLSDYERVADKMPICRQSIRPADVHGNPKNGDQPGGQDYSTLNLYLGDLYPYAGCEFYFDIHNDGTVPAHLSLDLTSISWQEIRESFNFEWSGDCRIDEAETRSRTLTGWLQLEDGKGNAIQLHSGDELLCKLRITLKQKNVEGQMFNFAITIRGHQWNESASGGPSSP